MDIRLFEAALVGDDNSLNSLLQDAEILNRAAVDGKDNPLHVASIYGHLQIAKNLLDKKPQLATMLNSQRSLPLHLASSKGHVGIVAELLTRDKNLCCIRDEDGRTPLHLAALRNRRGVVDIILDRMQEHARELAQQLDSQRCSPLHLASASGHLPIVEKLLPVNPEMCLVPDQNGHTPLHVAAFKGHTEVVTYLITQRPKLAWLLTDLMEPILHFCMNYNRFEIVKVLLDSAGDPKIVNLDRKFVEMKDANDNTILHLATMKKHKPMLEHLINQTEVDVNAKNMDGLTALDSLLLSPYEPEVEEVLAILRRKQPESRIKVHPARQPHEGDDKWLENTRGSLMIVAILISTVTFQAALNPPGGVYQDTTYGDPSEKYWHYVGEAVLSYRAPLRYTVFVIFNGIGFVASLLIILLLLSELPLDQKHIMRILTVIMWVAVSTMLISYAYLSSALTSSIVRRSLRRRINIPIAVFGMVTFFSLLFGAHTVRWASRYLRRYGIMKTKRHSKSTWKETRPQLIFPCFVYLLGILDWICCGLITRICG
ncbi:hypothetical protein ACLOJK_035332 [Asimina triloba]